MKSCDFMSHIVKGMPDGAAVRWESIFDDLARDHFVCCGGDAFFCTKRLYTQLRRLPPEQLRKLHPRCTDWIFLGLRTPSELKADFARLKISDVHIAAKLVQNGCLTVFRMVF